GPARTRANRRLVDGELGPERAHRGGAGAPCAAPPDRRGGLWRAGLCRRRPWRARAFGRCFPRPCPLRRHFRDPCLLPAWARRACVLAGAAALQAALGVATLLFFAPLGLALVHQALALALFGFAVAHWRETQMEKGA